MQSILWIRSQAIPPCPTPSNTKAREETWINKCQWHQRDDSPLEVKGCPLTTFCCLRVLVGKRIAYHGLSSGECSQAPTNAMEYAALPTSKLHKNIDYRIYCNIWLSGVRNSALRHWRPVSTCNNLVFTQNAIKSIKCSWQSVPAHERWPDTITPFGCAYAVKFLRPSWTSARSHENSWNSVLTGSVSFMLPTSCERLFCPASPPRAVNWIE